ncbi:MAG: RNA methyltransferase [Candidatus Pacebacteria bacterium]|nr:RNA methyltransferase [Candidatus Paceibacterota bacterium]
MELVKIGKENARFQILNALKTNREKRNHEGFLFEGVRNINNAITYNWNIKAFFYSSEKGLSDWAKDILENSKAETHYDLSLELLNKLSNKEEASELLALAEIPEDNFEKVQLKENPLIVIFDRPSSPGNLGTIIRSCDALGVDGLVITGHAVDVYDPETISATTGSLFSLPIVRVQSQKELEDWIGVMRNKYPALQVIGTDEKGSETIYEHDFKTPTILLVGNEKWGLSAGYKELADTMVNIPMQGSASSLNVAVATGMVLSEISRQRAS